MHRLYTMTAAGWSLYCAGSAGFIAGLREDLERRGVTCRVMES